MGKGLMLDLKLKDKKIALFCPAFFGYDNDIKDTLEESGAKVFLYDERVFTSTLGRGLVRLGFHRLVSPYIDRFYSENLVNKASELDYILLVNPETVPVEVLKRAKKNNPKIKIITYMWDSFNNKPYSNKYIEVSSSFFTFDPSDAKEHNVAFLPLFYVNEYENLSNKEVKYDLTFIGTAHSERFESVSNIVKHFDNKFLFFYCPSYMVFLFKKYMKGELQGLNLSDVSFSSMSRDKVLDLIAKTNTIIDISHPSQIGLTMRTIEMLGAGKKIVTTNSQILSYDFYHPSNILYVDDKTSAEEINSFVNAPYSPIESELRKKYSINSWIERLFI